ncbi:hypothetical protein Syun_003862 [Stephania yunnanensis]|uniref:Uncharacterized protein n=1 Tax=Stephania yunnanensis TaxID=152371 RepID=A0AAP0L4I9_9MAGN
MEALNGSTTYSSGYGYLHLHLPRVVSTDSTSVNYSCSIGQIGEIKRVSTKNSPNSNDNHNVHTMPEPRMLENTSCFGSTSSSPSMSNFPPIRLHVADKF